MIQVISARMAQLWYYLGLIAQQLEGDRVRDLEGQKLDVERSLVELEIYPHVLQLTTPVSHGPGWLQVCKQIN